MCSTKGRTDGDRFFSDILKRTECQYELYKDIAPFSTVKISSVARAVAYPNSKEQLIELIDILNKNEIPFCVVGGMSNVLIKNGIYNGVLIITSKIKEKNRAEHKVTLACGERLSSVITEMAVIGLGGLEGLAGIPGTVGGMVKQNAGAFGYEIKDRFKEALCYVPSESRICRFTKEDMRFSYRESVLSESDTILLCASFDFVPRDSEEILSSIVEYRKARLLSQPCEYPSLGCTFKRYGGVGAGYYVDRSGLKGCSVGGARVSEKHAGFIINCGGATADDYLGLAYLIKERVYSTFGVELEEEIQII